MEGVFFLLALVVCVHGTSHLFFSNDTSKVIVTLSGCGVTKSCVSSPNSCDPAEQSACLFASTAARDRVELEVELRGDSAGYIALGLAADATEGTLALFVCASDDGTFFFRTLQGNISNPKANLTTKETRVKEIRGTVSGNVIKCQFTVESLNAASLNAAQSRSSQATTFFVRLGNGNVTGDVVGVFSTVLDLGALDLAAAAASKTTTVTPTTATPTTATPGGATTDSTGNNSTTTDGGGAARPHAALLSVLTLSVLMRG